MGLQAARDLATITLVSTRNGPRRVPWDASEAAKIKALAKKQGYSQHQIKDWLGLSQSTVSKILAGVPETIQLRHLNVMRERLGLEPIEDSGDPFDVLRELRDLSAGAFRAIMDDAKERLKLARKLASRRL